MGNDVAEEYEALIQFLYLAPVGLVQTRLDGEIVMINPLSAQLLMPLSRDGGLDNLFTALEDVAPEVRHLAAAFGPSHGTVCDAMRIQLDAGVPGVSDPRMLSLNLLRLDATRLMAVLSDVTLVVKRERLLRQNATWFNALLTGVSDYALVGLDAGGRIAEWNAGLGRVTGFSREQAVGQPYSIFYPDDATTPERLLDRLHEADQDGWSLDEGWRSRADGSRFWGSAMIAPVPHADGLGGVDGATVPAGQDEHAYCLVIRDITDKREASESLRRAASCDHLTGIANRRTFFEAAELELERCRRMPRQLSLIVFDADHFKRVNDTHGHPAGDAVLCHLAATLSATFRQVDVVARLGGEEFVVLLPSTDAHGAALVADRLRRAVAAQPVEVDGVPIRYTVSGGVASMPDAALYAAKAAGRNRIECAAPA